MSEDASIQRTDDVLLNKAAIIERCILRIRDIYEPDPKGFLSDLTLQDAAMLNLLRACEAALDAAFHLVRKHGLGVPQSRRDAFLILANRGILDSELAHAMISMVGFCNIAVHDYQAVDMEIFTTILEKDKDDLIRFSTFLIGLAQGS